MDDLKEFLNDLRKQYGDNAVFTIEEDYKVDVDVISTGSLSLDLALGVGGIPCGRLTELYGSDGTGKTTLCFHIVAEAQKLGYNVLFVDMENSVDLKYAERIGVDIRSVVWNQPSFMEEALGVIETAINSNKFKLIVLDSVASLAPLKEQEDDLESANIALTPRALSKFFRRNTYTIRENKVAMLFTNQIRDKVGSFFGGVQTPGGHALKHFRSVALEIKRIADVKIAGNVAGHTVKVVVKKNKVASPFKEAEFDILYGYGIDKYRDLLEVAKNLGVVLLKGSYYVFEDQSLGQGKEVAANNLKENEALANLIRERCITNG